jgi:hypothetical protein
LGDKSEENTFSNDVEKDESAQNSQLANLMCKLSKSFLPVYWGIGLKGGYPNLKGKSTYSCQLDSTVDLIY